jgi:hypothetical protein
MKNDSFVALSNELIVYAYFFCQCPGFRCIQVITTISTYLFSDADPPMDRYNFTTALVSP